MAVLGRLWLGFALAAAVVAPGLAADEDARFGLCRQNVAAVALASSGDGVRVQVRLIEAAARRFERLSRGVRGRRLTVLAGGKVFSRAVIRVPVTSGTLVSPPLSEPEAARLAERVRRRQPGGDCGPVTE